MRDLAVVLCVLGAFFVMMAGAVHFAMEASRPICLKGSPLCLPAVVVSPGM